MRFDVITLFPEIIKNYCTSSIIGRAQSKNVVTINAINPRDFSQDKHKKVDDTPYGGGSGMVLMCDPIFRAVESIEKLENSQILMLTPQGKPFNQKYAEELGKNDQLLLLCGHYEGFDERIRTELNVEEISIGDFVLTGGELGALCIIDAVSRYKEGALGKIESTEEESFSENLLEYPHYTKPREYKGINVPDVLLSGNHAAIKKWRRKQQFIRTMQKRPDLFEKFQKTNLSKDDKKILKELSIED